MKHCARFVQYDSAIKNKEGFPAGSVVKNPPASMGDVVRSPIQEDPTCWGPTKPVPTAIEPVLKACQPPASETCMPRARGLRQEKPLQWEARAPQVEGSSHSPQLEKSSRKSATKTQHSHK